MNYFDQPKTNSDLRLIQQAVCWIQEGRTVWLATVLSSANCSNIKPGAMLVSASGRKSFGSIGDKYLDEYLLSRVESGGYKKPSEIVSRSAIFEHLRIDTEDILELLIEKFEPETERSMHLGLIEKILASDQILVRHIQHGRDPTLILQFDPTHPRITRTASHVSIRLGVVPQLIIAGLSEVAEYCANSRTLLGTK